ncbi:MAG: hypothetical protein D6726_06445 [Nitrospirae bacterium]|nr:MAG: hypothetical protein D6726_06445 [Nitrospirota bacterium]
MDVHREVETSSEGTPSLRGGRWGEGVLSQSEEGCINLFPHFNEWSLWYAMFFYGICAAVTQAVISRYLRYRENPGFSRVLPALLYKGCWLF